MPTPRDHRRHPRIRAAQSAEVEVRVPRHRRVQATICSASADGLGLSLIGKHAEDVLRGRTVTVHFAVGNEPVQLPGKVAWHRPAPAGGEAGVRVHLAIAGTSMRETYGAWVAQLLRAEAR